MEGIQIADRNDAGADLLIHSILSRPEMYVGNTNKITEFQYVLDEDKGIIFKEVTYVPALYKILDEILVNAADNFTRDPSMTTIRVTIDKERNQIKMFNDAEGFPIQNIQVFSRLLLSNSAHEERFIGLKLAIIFSKELTVEIASSASNKKFKQTFTNNGRARGDALETENTHGEEWTEITFKPDLELFKMESLEEDIVKIMHRRVWDVAGCNSALKVYLNDEKLPVKDFGDYVKMYFKDDPARTFVFEPTLDKAEKKCWEVAVTTRNDNHHKNVSFVNGIATKNGGTHETHVIESIAKAINVPVPKINQLQVFVNMTMNKPQFGSHAQDALLSQPSTFQSPFEASNQFYQSVAKMIVDSPSLESTEKLAPKEAKPKSKVKRSVLKGVPKLDDATEAGGPHASECTLILTEGDSAKALAISGLGVIGRQFYGVYPLRGKPLNVREATTNQVTQNEEISMVMRIMGLEIGKNYEDTSKLRYGHVMIMADQDYDGSHIKGLVINIFHKFWPSLLKVPGFLLEFITPIVKVTKGNQMQWFYNMPEYEDWKNQNENGSGWKSKYYKGLGTSTAQEARQYFSALDRHKKEFVYRDEDDDAAIDLAFSKFKADQRKEWLLNFTHGTHLDVSVNSIPFTEFVNKELILFSVAVCVRSIPSLVDGLKPGQRKVLYACFKRNFRSSVRVAQLSGYISETASYHHGEMSLQQTIVLMAQNFVGSNNINILEPIGQFGTRLMGGRDSASPRYIHTQLSKLARKLFHADDDKLVTYLEEDGLKIEPEWYIPVIPMVLINGANGIGTGWSTAIPNYNPRDVIENIRRLMAKQPLRPLTPWYRGFKGTVEWNAPKNAYVVRGVWNRLDDDTLEVLELPIGLWTQTFKEMLAAEIDKPDATVKGFTDNSTDVVVNFTIKVPNLSRMSDNDVEKLFKLRTTLSTVNMHLFDAAGKITKFNTAEDIIAEFYPLRLDYYLKRKEYLANNINNKLMRFDNQLRFIDMLVNRELIVFNRNQADLIAELKEKKFDQMTTEAKKPVINIVPSNDDDISISESQEIDVDPPAGPKSFDYLVSMPIWTLTAEAISTLRNERNECQKELDDLLATSPEQMWETDLQAFLEAWESFERDQEANNNKGKKQKKTAKIKNP